MARFDVYALTGSGGYVIDCQADILSDIGTRFVVPLLREGEVPPSVPRLHPRFEIEGEWLVMATHLAATVPVRGLGMRVLTLKDQGDAISAALDVLLMGF
jgi:toxin CcdB